MHYTNVHITTREHVNSSRIPHDKKKQPITACVRLHDGRFNALVHQTLSDVHSDRSTDDRVCIGNQLITEVEPTQQRHEMTSAGKVTSVVQQT